MSDQREIGPELVRRVTHLNDVLEENDRLHAEIASLRLTDAEREAVEECCEWAMVADHRSLAVTLRGLLDRLGGAAKLD